MHVRLRSLSEIQSLQSFTPRPKADRAIAEAFEVPKVGQHAAPAPTESFIEHSFKRPEFWRSEPAFLDALFHDAIAGSSWDDGCDAGAAVEGERQRSQGPFDASGFVKQRGPQQNEGSNGDTGGNQSASGVGVVCDGELLIEGRERLGMNRFQAHRDFQCLVGGQKPTETRDIGAAQSWVVLNDNGVEAGDQGGYRWIIVDGDRTRIKEVAAVVQFDVAGGRQPGQSVSDLLRDRSDGRWGVERMLPKVAHQTAEATLAVGQEQRGDGFGLARCVAFQFNERGVGLSWVHMRLGWPGREDTAFGKHGVETLERPSTFISSVG